MDRYQARELLGLGVHPQAEEIRKSYRELAQLYHPDKVGDNKRLQERAAAQFKLVTEARDILLKELESQSPTSLASQHETTYVDQQGYSSQVADPSQDNANYSVPASKSAYGNPSYHALMTAKLTFENCKEGAQEQRRRAFLSLVAALLFFKYAKPISAILLIFGIYDLVVSYRDLKAIQAQLSLIDTQLQQHSSAS